MRITSNMFPDALMQQSNTLLQREFTVQNQISTGMSIINASDDPATFAQVSLLRGQNSESNTYLSVTNSLTLNAQNTYQGMSNLQSILSSVSELMTEANNSSSQTQMQIYGNQMQGYAKQILQIVNQNKDGVYTYGSVNNQPPLVSSSTATSAYAAPAAAETLNVNGFNVSINAGDSFATMKQEIEKAAPGVTVTQNSSSQMVITSATQPLTLSETGGTFLSGQGLASNPNMVLNDTSSGYGPQVATATINTNLTVSLGLTAGSDTSGGSNFAGFLTTGVAGSTDLYNMVVSAANDMLAGTGNGTDAFASDTVLGGSYSAAVQAIDSATGNVSVYVGRASAQLALIDSNQTELSTDVLNQKQALAGLTQVNTANAATELSQIQTAYQAALQSGSKILNLSLLNYLS